jgi:hypothetical protein
MALKTELIRDFDRFLKLKQSWNELVKTTESDLVCMWHEWFECWIKTLGRRETLTILTEWSDGQLVAIAPLQLEWRRFKGLPARTLSFLSSSISPRCNFIVHESMDPRRFFEKVLHISGYDLIHTVGMEATLSVTNAYVEFLKQRKSSTYEIEPGRRSPFLLTSTSWEEYRQSLPRQFRTNLTTRWNKLKQAANSYQVEKITDYETFATVFDELVETSARSWKAQTKTDLRSTPKIQQFYKDFSYLTSDQQLYEVWLLRIDGKLAAFEYYLKGNRSLSAIRTDFDMAFKIYGPGHSLKVLVLQDVFAREGVWEYDFGGLAYDFKMRWTKTVREHLNITTCGNNLYGKVLMFGKKRLLPLIRSVRRREQAADDQPEPS